MAAGAVVSRGYPSSDRPASDLRQPPPGPGLGVLNLDRINEELGGAGCLRPRTAAALIAEVKRLRAENEELANEVMAHQTTSDYERGHEHGTLSGLKARNVVPCSALRRIGIHHDSLNVIDLGPKREVCYWNCRPGCKRTDIYMIEEQEGS